MRYHLFADETGQHTRGLYFVIGVAVMQTPDQDEVRARLLDLEARAGRAGQKWARATIKQKIKFLEGVGPLLDRFSPAYYRSCGPGLDYADWTATVVAAAATARDADGEYYVVIDGVADTRRVLKAFRARGLKRKDIRGGRDESEPLLRLADFVAGFVADQERGCEYAAPFWSRLAGFFEAV